LNLSLAYLEKKTKQSIVDPLRDILSRLERLEDYGGLMLAKEIAKTRKRNGVHMSGNSGKKDEVIVFHRTDCEIYQWLGKQGHVYHTQLFNSTKPSATFFKCQEISVMDMFRF